MKPLISQDASNSSIIFIWQKDEWTAAIHANKNFSNFICYTQLAFIFTSIRYLFYLTNKLTRLVLWYLTYNFECFPDVLHKGNCNSTYSLYMKFSTIEHCCMHSFIFVELTCANDKNPSGPAMRKISFHFWKKNLRSRLDIIFVTNRFNQIIQYTLTHQKNITENTILRILWLLEKKVKP